MIPPRPVRERPRYKLAVVQRRSRSETQKLPQWLPQSQLQWLRFSRCPYNRRERKPFIRTRRPSPVAYLRTSAGRHRHTARGSGGRARTRRRRPGADRPPAAANRQAAACALRPSLRTYDPADRADGARPGGGGSDSDRGRDCRRAGGGMHDKRGGLRPQAPFAPAVPEHLPRERVVEPAPVSCLCCGSARLRRLGEDVTETLEVIPRSWKVIQNVREKFTCRDCEAISQPSPAPGSMCVMTGRLAARHRRLPYSTTPAIAAGNIRKPTWRDMPASCRPTLMAATASCTKPAEVPARSWKPGVGRTHAASSSCWPTWNQRLGAAHRERAKR